MQSRLAKIVSVITVVPIIAAFAITTVFFVKGEYFNYSLNWYVFTLFFLTLMPISAYGLKYFIPSIRKQGRAGERKLAFIMAVLGYVIGTVVSFLVKVPKGVLLIFLAYLFSGGVLAFINKVIGFKASGHACGVSGPITLMVYMIGPYALYTCILIPIVFWARLTQKRHKVTELIAGTCVGIVSTILAIVVYQFFI
ncbi:MAG: hypothetical protein PHP06_06245 [Clostridia bacterium]|nr:hypothetical protein [Clostridia bacterium]